MNPVRTETGSSVTPAAGNLPLVFLTSLFFMWGLMTSLNDILIPHLRNAFALSYTQAMLIQFCFFGAYALVSLPAGKLLERIGYQRGIVAGLAIAGLGCWIFWPAAATLSYPFFLGALFVLAAGITILQVSANPYVSALGEPRTASSRLTLTQAFNSLGTTVGPLFGGLLILTAAGATLGDGAAAEARTVQMPYLLLGGLFFILAAVFLKLRLPVLAIEKGVHPTAAIAGKTAWSFSHLKFGTIAIFVYVGAEVGIGSFLINYFGEDHVAALAEVDAAPYVAYYWGGAMVGRFIGAAVMRRVPAGTVLGCCALAAALFICISMFSTGIVAMWSIILVGLCNSIMFPTIFSLAVAGLGPYTSQGSGLLCMAIVGGAILPVLQGMIADASAIQWSFALPVLCYFYICFYGWKGSSPKDAVY
jgi:MFS transporter, FHS family, L-fucose permease